MYPLFFMFIWRYKTISKENLINEEIRDKELRIISNDGEQLGVMSREEAMSLAEAKGMDLVSISPNANPPVCKILDYGKYRYELQKKEKLVIKHSNIDCPAEKPSKEIVLKLPEIKCLPPPPPPPFWSKIMKNSAVIPTPPPFNMNLSNNSNASISIKKKVSSKYKLPSLNWAPLKPNQIRGTIFFEMQDDKLSDSIDFEDFEENFKIGNELNDTQKPCVIAKCFKKLEISLLDSGRFRNISICHKKLNLNVNEVIFALNAFDLQKLSLDKVELLLNIIPKEQEVKLFKNYVKDKKDVQLLSSVDKYLMELVKIEKLSSKLEIMIVLGNFEERSSSLLHQLGKISSASTVVRCICVNCIFLIVNSIVYSISF